MACLKAGFLMSALPVEIQPESVEKLGRPPVWRADLLEQDRWSQHRTARFLGDVALDNSVEYQTEPSTVTLLSLTQKAAEGYHEAYLGMRANVNSAVVEALYKTGHIIRIELEDSQTGSLQQHGHDVLDVQANALVYGTKHPNLVARTKVEALNAHRLLDLKQAGWLEDHWLVVESFYPDDVSDEVAGQAGFFRGSRAGVIQASTIDARGTCVTESAFIHGQNGKTVAAAHQLHAQWGDHEAGSTTELLARPRLVPKSLMPNGVYDYVQLLAQASQEPGLFREYTESDAQTFLAICQQREANLQRAVDAVADRLLSTVDQLQTPVDAIERLYQLVAEEAFEHAKLDVSIDVRVFGPKAAPLIEQGRQLYAQGDFGAAERVLAEAKAVAEVTMCGFGGKKDSSDNAAGEAQTGSRTETLKCVTCPECGEIVDAKVFHDKDNKKKTISCPKCKAVKIYDDE